MKIAATKSAQFVLDGKRDKGTSNVEETSHIENQARSIRKIMQCRLNWKGIGQLNGVLFRLFRLNLMGGRGRGAFIYLLPREDDCCRPHTNTN